MNPWLIILSIGVLLWITAVFVERRREFIMAKAREWYDALNRLRKGTAQSPPTPAEAPTVITTPAFSLDYEQGLAHLERGERDEAVKIFTRVFRTASDHVLKQKALEQLERLGAAKKF